MNKTHLNTEGASDIAAIAVCVCELGPRRTLVCRSPYPGVIIKNPVAESSAFNYTSRSVRRTLWLRGASRFATIAVGDSAETEQKWRLRSRDSILFLRGVWGGGGMIQAERLCVKGWTVNTGHPTPPPGCAMPLLRITQSGVVQWLC